MGWIGQLKSILSGGKLDVDQRFELLREAVHGTMSKFHMARDRKSGAIVGLKLLDPEKTARFEERFAGLNKPCEGEIAMSLSHPGIVVTLEHGLTTRDQQYLVMEFLEGQGLNTLLLARGSELDGRRLVLLQQAAEATLAVHQAGFIHRDICPRNFVVAPDFTSLKLIDFGLSVPNTPPFRRPGNRTGTPKYMSPEVVRRRSTDLRLDIFSFGVTAYEMFAFQTPWPTAIATGKAAMEHDKAPVPITDCCPQIAPELAKAIHACLKPNPDDRPKSIEEFLRVVRRIKSETVS